LLSPEASTFYFSAYRVQEISLELSIVATVSIEWQGPMRVGFSAAILFPVFSENIIQ
jgi:hypothetical protein